MRRIEIFAILLGVLIVPLVAWALCGNPPPSIEAQVLSVIDGDTSEVRIESLPEQLAAQIPELSLGRTVEVRYIGIDTQETHHPQVPVECFGPEATEFNAQLIEGKKVYLELDEQPWDKYGRLLAYVYLDPSGYQMVNLILLALGYADLMIIEPNTRYRGVFESYERVAIQNGLGMWSHCVIGWDEATDHLEEEMVVEGEVKSVGFSSEGTAFLNLGNPYPLSPRFTVVIWPEYRPHIEEKLGDLKALEGKTIRVYGTIELYKGIPEIELCDPDYIWIVRAPPQGESSLPSECTINVIVESVKLVYNNHVGNDWVWKLSVNDQPVSLALYALPQTVWTGSLTNSTTLTVTATVIEEDKSPDIGRASATFNISCDPPSSSQTSSLEVLVREDRGRYAGNTALWCLQIRVEVLP